MAKQKVQKIVLAYSGGLDTSVLVRVLSVDYGYDASDAILTVSDSGRILFANRAAESLLARLRLDPREVALLQHALEQHRAHHSPPSHNPYPHHRVFPVHSLFAARSLVRLECRMQTRHRIGVDVATVAKSVRPARALDRKAELAIQRDRRRVVDVNRELDAQQSILAYYDAQRDYAIEDRNGDGVLDPGEQLVANAPRLSYASAASFPGRG